MIGDKPVLQARLMINQPGDRWEQEADQAAEAVLMGKFPKIVNPGSAKAAVQREETTKKKSESEKYKEAASKVGEAFLETEVGKQIKDKAKELGESFISTLPGKIITGAAAAGAVSTIIATNSELPIQAPEIPLEGISPGLSMKITYEGPVRKPTKAMISFTYKFGGSKTEEKKPALTEAEKRRAETAKLAAELHEFRESMKSPEQKATEQQAFWDAYWRMQANDPLNPLYLPSLKPKKEEDLLLMRKEAGVSTSAAAPDQVMDAINSSGKPLDTATQDAMETRFGYDFSQVRVHIDSKAAQAAKLVDAQAYTFGNHIVFGSGYYSPSSQEGMRLLAHELTHTIQQRGDKKAVQRQEPPFRVAATLLQRQPASLSAVPASERQSIRISVVEIQIPTRILDEVFPSAANNQRPTTSYVPPARVVFASGIVAGLQRGLQSVGGYLTNQTNALPLNHSINIALDLSAYGGANTVYRFTHYTHTENRATTNYLLIEEVGAAPAAPAAVTAAAGSFNVGGSSFTLGRGWSDARFGLLRHALSQLPASALTEAAGLTFNYTSRAGTGSEAGEYHQDTDTVELFSNAFPTTDMRVGGQDIAVRNILHEVGHAIDLRPLERAWQQFNTAGQSASARRTFLRVRSPSGTRYRRTQTGDYEQDLALNDRSGAFRQAVRRDGVRRDTSGRTTGSGSTAGLSGGITDYSDTDYQELFAESYALYMTDPDRLRLLRPNTYQFFARRYPRTP